jgi:exonuclease VII large subunit
MEKGAAMVRALTVPVIAAIVVLFTAVNSSSQAVDYYGPREAPGSTSWEMYRQEQVESQLEMQRQQIEMQGQRLELQRQQLELQRQQLEMQRQQLEMQRPQRQMELEKQRTERQKQQSE